MSKAIQSQTAFLDSNISNIEDEIIVRDLNDIYGNQVSFVSPIMYLTIEPLSSTNQEIISCTGIEVVSDTKVRLTGVVRGLAAQPGVSGTARSHGANLEIILTNNPQFYDGIGFLDEDETVTGDWTFDVAPNVPTPTTGQQAVNKDFAEGLANQGAADASTTTKGISRLSASPTTTLGTATVTVASPAVVTLASHGLTANDSIQFTTSGALPTGLLPSVTYYVIAAGLTSSAFELSLTLGGAAINTTGTQSGTHTLYKTTPVAVGVNDTKMLTQDENNAAAGAGGSPSSSNLYETQYDTSNGSTKTATTISFAAGTKTISDSGNGFVTANFRQGTQVTVAGSASNNGTFTIVSVAAGAIVVAESLVNESAGATVVMTTVSANKLARYSSTSQLKVPIVPVATDDAASKSYAESLVPSTSYFLGTDTPATYFTTTVPILAASGSALSGWTVATFAISPTNNAAGYSVLGASSGGAWTILALLPGTGSSAFYTPALTGKELRLKNSMRFGSTSDRAGFGIVVTAATIYTAQTDITDGTVRFIKNGGTLYAHNSNGSTATSTDVTGGRTLTDRHVYEIVYTPGTNILFYIDGTLVATHATNMPTTGNLSMGMGVDANGRTIETCHPILTIKQ